jgi:hypothetical protein
MMVAIRAGTDQKVGVQDWQEGSDGKKSTGCNDFKDVHGWDAQTVFLNTRDTPTGISDGDWPKAVQVLTEVSSWYGFNRKGLEVGKPPYHKLSINDDTNAEITLFN